MTITKQNLVCAKGPWSSFQVLRDRLQEITGRRAGDYHDSVVEFLKARGWRVFREYAVAANGRGGRVDVVAFRDDVNLALELDNRSPRERSIEKLKLFPASWLTGILLRDPK